MIFSSRCRYFGVVLRQYSALVDREAMLYAKRIRYRGGRGQEITVDAVYQVKKI